MNVCTIIAKNYVAQARVLARSFAEHHPEGRFWTLVIDDFAGHIDPAAEPYVLLTPSDIGCEPFADMAVRYNVLELSTAVKPWLLRHLMRQESRPITYLDPDIQVFGPLDELDELAQAHGVVLTPHNTEPIPADGKRPTQIDIMIAGVYNLGYISLAPSEEIDELLDWWSDRLRRDCRVDPVYGYFVDQRWFDLAPGFVSDYAIMREPQFNVAYWNLHSRKLEHDGERYIVDGRPLAFFHFSGFDPEQASIISRHQDRIAVEEGSTLQRILGEYAVAAKREGFNAAHNWPYTFGTLSDGTRMDPVMRELFIMAQGRGELSESPFEPEGAKAFLDWLGAQAPGAPAGVHRLLAHLYGTRGDLKQAFPDLSGPDLGRLLSWTREDGRVEVPALGRLALPDGGEEVLATAPPPPHSEVWGVNVVGYFSAELGVGEAARQVVSALDAGGVPVLPVQSASPTLSRQEHQFTGVDQRDARFPVNLLCVNADMLPDLVARAGRHFFAGRYSIGLWFWEVSRFREEWHGSFDLVDEVWAPTAHVADALTPVSPIPVVTMRIPVAMAPVAPRARDDLGLPEGFLFLFAFDYLSVFERKNPLAVVEAFSRAFTPGEGPSLVLKCINAEHDPAAHERLLAATAGREDIHIVDRYLSPSEKDGLTDACDCYVSLHRSEGFGLGMAEAMYLGKPVIATGYSGNLDFMTDENSLLVDYDIKPIGPGSPPYPADGQWAEPSVEHAAALMRLVVEDLDAAAALGTRAAEDIRRTHSPLAVGELMNERLEHLRVHPALRHAGGSADGWAPLVVSTLAGRVQRGPAPGSSTAAGSAGRFARRGLLRMLRPFTAYQEVVNAEVSRSLGAVGDEVEGLRENLVRGNARILAELRARERRGLLETHARMIDQTKVTLTELGGRVDRLDEGLQTDRSLYLALGELDRRHRAIVSTPSGEMSGLLAPFELRVFSQNGEDGVIAEILARIELDERRFFVEFGVESGREGNCVYLADVADWQGLFMDGDEGFFSDLQRKYAATERVRTALAMVTPENVQELFADAEVPLEPTVLSIDVDGTDYWIWEAIEDYRPRVVIVEYNSALDPRRRLVQPRDHRDGWDGTDYFGASLGAMSALGQRKGYRLVHAELSGVNAFFVREDLAVDRLPDAGDLFLRGMPNYFQRGISHPPDPHARRYTDLDTGELVDPDAGS